MRQVRSCSGSAEKSAVAVILKNSFPMKRRNHFATSAQVFVFSWFSVFAVTTPFVSAKVVRAHKMIHDTSADFPIPWPEVRAIWIASAPAVR